MEGMIIGRRVGGEKGEKGPRRWSPTVEAGQGRINGHRQPKILWVTEAAFGKRGPAKKGKKKKKAHTMSLEKAGEKAARRLARGEGAGETLTKKKRGCQEQERGRREKEKGEAPQTEEDGGDWSGRTVVKGGWDGKMSLTVRNG